MANTDHKVNHTVTRALTTHNTGIVNATADRGNTRTVDSCLNTGNGNLVLGIASPTSVRSILRGVHTRFNRISVLIGGTNVAHSGLLVQVGSRR